MAFGSKGFLDLNEAADVQNLISMDPSDTCSLRLAGLEEEPLDLPGCRAVWKRT